MANSEENGGGIHVAKREFGVPSKIDSAPFPFQISDYSRGPHHETKHEDMYAFFRAGDSSVTYDAVVELKGVILEPAALDSSYPISDSRLMNDKQAFAQVTKDRELATQIIEDHGGEVFLDEGESLFYMEISGNANMYRALAALPAVTAIRLYGDPSNLSDERNVQNRRRANVPLLKPSKKHVRLVQE